MTLEDTIGLILLTYGMFFAPPAGSGRDSRHLFFPEVNMLAVDTEVNYAKRY